MGVLRFAVVARCGSGEWRTGSPSRNSAHLISSGSCIIFCHFLLARGSLAYVQPLHTPRRELVLALAAGAQPQPEPLRSLHSSISGSPAFYFYERCFFPVTPSLGLSDSSSFGRLRFVYAA